MNTSPAPLAGDDPPSSSTSKSKPSAIKFDDRSTGSANDRSTKDKDAKLSRSGSLSGSMSQKLKGWIGKKDKSPVTPPAQVSDLPSPSSGPSTSHSRTDSTATLLANPASKNLSTSTVDLASKTHASDSASTVTASTGPVNPPRVTTVALSVTPTTATNAVPGPSNFLTVPQGGPAARVNETDGERHLRMVTQNAQMTVDHLNAAALWLSVAGQALEAGTSWMPMVGEAVQVVVSMLKAAEKIALAKVAALRLVDRCARILTAVINALKVHQHDLRPSAREVVARFIENVRFVGDLMDKLSKRPFFKLWLHSQEVNNQIKECNDDLANLTDVLNLQLQIEILAVTELNNERDREADNKLMLVTILGALEDDPSMISTLITDTKELAEARKTLERTLDHMKMAASPTIESSSTSVPTTPAAEAAVSPLDLDALNPFFVPQLPEGSSPLFTPQGSAWHSRAASMRSASGGNTSQPGSMSGSRIIFHSLNPAAASYAASAGAASLSTDSSPQSSIRIARAAPSVRSAPPFPSIGPDDPIRRYVEKALDLLRRESAPTDFALPDWTIGLLEVTHDKVIARSYFSEVYRGTWQGYPVAIKQLNNVTDSTAFKREVEVWRRLRSRHILPFLGASSTTGPAPWIIVSPYLKNGDILSYLLNHENSGPNRRHSRAVLVLQIAQGLEYLHSRDIIHGDFKAANVLITDEGDAVICDFGLSLLKSEARKEAGTSGTMRWQSPERMQGAPLAFSCDVYSFGITICELFGRALPFGMGADKIIRRSILAGTRPARPNKIPDALWKLAEACWAQDPGARPSFTDIVSRLEVICRTEPKAPKRARTIDTVISTSSESGVYRADIQEVQHVITPEDDTPPTSVSDEAASNRSLSLPASVQGRYSTQADQVQEDYQDFIKHDFDDRLTLPLWIPSVITLGSVGYLRNGRFVKLFDADFPPPDLPEPPQRTIGEFGLIETTISPVDTRTLMERGWDIVNGLVKFAKGGAETSELIDRRVTFPLKVGGVTARLVVEDARFEIYRSIAAPREYLTANIDWILEHFKDTHHIQKEDIILVFGALTAANHAMFVSHFTPRTTFTFNVHSHEQRVPGQEWGTWTCNREKAGAGVIQVDEEDFTRYTVKISKVSDSPRDTVLIAKLSFQRGSTTPTLW